MNLPVSFIAIILFLCANNLVGFHIDNLKVSKKAAKKIPPTLIPKDFFSHADLTIGRYKIITKPLALMQAAKDTLRYIEVHEASKNQTINPSGFKDLLPLADVKKTLKFLIATIQEDRASGVFRINNPEFIQQNFSCLEWSADAQGAQQHDVPLAGDGKIRLTSYAVLTAKGSKQRNANFPCALYRLIDPSIQKKYTKQQILAGALEKPANRAKRQALVWLSRQNLEDAIMHGTIVVTLPDGTSKIFNVDSNNGIPYDRNQKNVLAQKRYWFYRELPSSAKSGARAVARIKNRKNVIFAGDLKHLGIGKLIAIKHTNPNTKKQEMILGILADTGGAFNDNLYQLDIFGGIFENFNQLRAYRQQLPGFTQACVLYKK